MTAEAAVGVEAALPGAGVAWVRSSSVARVAPRCGETKDLGIERKEGGALGIWALWRGSEFREARVEGSWAWMGN